MPTDNHSYDTPTIGSIGDWGNDLNTNFEDMDIDVEIRDEDSNKSNYTPKSNAMFRATDTGAIYRGDGNNWNLMDIEVNSLSSKQGLTSTDGETSFDIQGDTVIGIIEPIRILGATGGDSNTSGQDVVLDAGDSGGSLSDGGSVVISGGSGGINDGDITVKSPLNLPNSDPIQDAGTDAIQFDGSANVTIPNGYLDISENDITNINRIETDSSDGSQIRVFGKHTDTELASFKDEFSDTGISPTQPAQVTTSVPFIPSSLYLGGSDIRAFLTGADIKIANADNGIFNVFQKLNMSNSNSIQDAGTDAIQFDGSANVSFPNHINASGSEQSQRGAPSTSELASGNCMTYCSDGSDAGSAGDLMYAVNDSGTIKTSIIAQRSNAT